MPLSVRGGSLTLVVFVVVLAAWPAQASANPQNAGVQIALRALGLYCGAIDGDVGPVTVAAIRSAQQQAGLPATGIADARTRAALGPLGRPLFGTRVLEVGDFGLDVSVLQFALVGSGLYHGALDGYLGKQTEAAVRRFQRRERLTADGVVGPLTAAALVRGAKIPVRTPPALPAEPKVVYVVRPGDSLTAIAGRYGLSPTSLAKANSFDPSGVLVIGRRLTIPAPALEPTHADIQARLDAWSASLGVSSRLVRALAWMESGYQTRVVSTVGARGVMQTLPSTRQFVEEVLAGRPIPNTPDGDIEVGVLFIRHLLAEFGGDESLALAAWYQGAAAVRKYGVFQVTKPFVADVLALEARM